MIFNNIPVLLIRTIEYSFVNPFNVVLFILLRMSLHWTMCSFNNWNISNVSVTQISIL